MKLQFKVQPYQTAAVDAVVDCFAGQPRYDGVSYRIDPGRGASQRFAEFDSGLKNHEIELSAQRLLENVQSVQRRQGLTASRSLVPSIAAPSALNLDVEMETGTGKTYVYIKTIMELHKRYGWGKFIVVVPSVAIREGVKKTFDITAEHFQDHYHTKPRAFVYNSARLHDVESFSSDAGVQVMIINIQAFNAFSGTGKESRRINEMQESFGWRKPIDVISANRPIIVIDEPQKIGSDRSLRALATFKALAILRYSATHTATHNTVHRLDAVDAYNRKLVKKIAVRGITVKGLAGSTAYLYLDAIEIKRGAKPRARIEIEVQPKVGPIRRLVKRLDQGANLWEVSNGIEAYKNLFIVNVDASRDVVELSNGALLEVGQITADVTEEQKRRIQIREVIRAHLDKEKRLFERQIKVLSLFFIDEVAKYRDYLREDTLGEYARVFQEEYEAAVAELLEELPLDESVAEYQRYLQRDSARAVHEGYFAIDKKTREFENPKVAKRGEDAGQSTDVDAYDLILRNKERLLSLDEPVRFLFSHSALREGWDNPNVFVMGMLKKSDNIVSRRQEIGRGLRLAVDQHGERMDDRETVHEINQLTVVTDESYTDFVTGLQQEIAATLASRPRQATVEYFVGKSLKHADGSDVVITVEQAEMLQHWLIKNDFIDHKKVLTEAWVDRGGAEIPPLPGGLDEFHHQVTEYIDSLWKDITVPLDDDRRAKEIPFNKANFDKAEFQQLWGQINNRAVYRVDFDSAELIDACVIALDQRLRVTAMQYVVESGVQRTSIDVESLEKGVGFAVESTRTHAEERSASSRVPYDLLGEIAEKTQLTRRTVAAILREVLPTTFAKYKQNPENFIGEAATIINDEKATAVIEHLSYDTLAERYDSAIFTQNQTTQNFAAAGPLLKKHVYDYIVTDSGVERAFVNTLDTSDEVAVYAKLPRGFFIPTPVGNYNPDWAIAFHDGAVKHVYFVAETKGSLRSMELRGAELAKIDCATKYFDGLNRRGGREVVYKAITGYDDLMQVVGAGAGS